MDSSSKRAGSSDEKMNEFFFAGNPIYLLVLLGLGVLGELLIFLGLGIATLGNADFFGWLLSRKTNKKLDKINKQLSRDYSLKSRCEK